MMVFKLNIHSLRVLLLAIGKRTTLDTTLTAVPFFACFRGLPIALYGSAF